MESEEIFQVVLAIALPIIFFIGFAYGAYRIIKWILRTAKRANDAQLSAASTLKEDVQAPKLSGKFEAIVEKLEQDRIIAKHKTSGLYKRSFLRAWGIMGGTALVLVLTLTEREIGIEDIIGPSLMTAILAAIGSGIYTLIKKETKRRAFVAKLKKELVSKIVKHVNQDLTFYDEGIDKEEFLKADLFRGREVKSEDTIKGNIEGKNVVISECTNSSYKGSSSGSGGSTTTFFNGIFVILELAHTNTTTPIKIVPSRISDNNEFDKTTGIRKRFKKMNIEAADLIEIDPSLKKSSFDIYCANKSEANDFINETSLKVLDYIFNKYETESESLFGDIPILKNFKINNGVYISVVGNKLYMAIDWAVDLFEPDAFLNKNLMESGIAQNIHKDLLFINQVVKEANLLDKING